MGTLVLLVWFVLTRGLALLSRLLVRLGTLLAGILPALVLLLAALILLLVLIGHAILSFGSMDAAIFCSWGVIPALLGVRRLICADLYLCVMRLFVRHATLWKGTLVRALLA